MHPDLSSHLHSVECNILIEKLQQCHNSNKFGKFFGACNELDAQVYRCLMREREEKRKRNAEAGLRKRAQIIKA